MGRVCRVCYRQRPHECFGGRGQRAYVCKTCRQRPKEERQRILLTDELLGFLQQSNISAKNILRLKWMENTGIESVVRLANLVRRIAEVKPRKRKRCGFLRNNHHDLFQLAVEAGIHEAFETEDGEDGEDGEDEWMLEYYQGIPDESLPDGETPNPHPQDIPF